MVSGAGLIAAIFTDLVQAVRARGGSDEDIHRLVTPDGKHLMEKIADLIVTTGGITFSRDMRKEGWTLLEPGPKRVIKSVSDLELVGFLKSGEEYIDGEELIRRARQELNADLGQEDAEWLLAHQDQIPKEWRGYFLTFPGTVWQGSRGHRYIPDLYWSDGRWFLHFDWLGYDWSDRARLLRFRK